MLKRYPPICGNSDEIETTKPQFVQLMLVEFDGSDYHRSLLHAVYNHRGQLRMKFLKSTSNDDCSTPQNPSIMPGTLFMLSYK